MKENFENILKKHGIYGEEVEDVLYAVEDMLRFAANKTKEEEPYAIHSIRQMNDAAYQVYDLTSYL